MPIGGASAWEGLRLQSAQQACFFHYQFDHLMGSLKNIFVQKLEICVVFNKVTFLSINFSPINFRDMVKKLVNLFDFCQAFITDHLKLIFQIKMLVWDSMLPRNLDSGI